MEPNLINLTINKFLLLKDFAFKDPSNNIDYLNQQATLKNNLEESLSLLNLATSKIEKFHSFFHFEQSYFHLQLAIEYSKQNQKEEMEEQLKAAIFQDHLNNQAKSMLDNKKNNSIYQRPYSNFSEYIKFATEEEPNSFNLLDSYWNDYIEYNKNHDKKLLIKIIDKIRYHHLHYHEESAKLYLNRAIIFYHLDQFSLSKNDIVKAKNLDMNLTQKEYMINLHFKEE